MMTMFTFEEKNSGSYHPNNAASRRASKNVPLTRAQIRPGRYSPTRILRMRAQAH